MVSIQASLNQLVLSSIGAVGGVAHGVKGTFNKPVKHAAEAEQPKAEQPKAETTSGMGNIAKIGKNYSRTNIRSYEAAARSVDAGNEVIGSKAKSHFDPIALRLQEVNQAISSFAASEKEDKK